MKSVPEVEIVKCYFAMSLSRDQPNILLQVGTIEFVQGKGVTQLALHAQAFFTLQFYTAECPHMVAAFVSTKVTLQDSIQWRRRLNVWLLRDSQAKAVKEHLILRRLPAELASFYYMFASGGRTIQTFVIGLPWFAWFGLCKPMANQIDQNPKRKFYCMTKA